MPPVFGGGGGAGALDSGNPDSEDESSKQSKLAARAARFSQKLPGNRYKELEEMRIKERKAFEAQGLIKLGKMELGQAVDMRGTCERLCSEYEREFREYTREIHPFEAGPSKRMDPDKAVAAYSRSDAGAGHGDAAILPSDLRTPGTLVRTLDYLFNIIMPTLPPSTSSITPTPRKALGYSAGFIRDRTRAIRKEFAMQSSWGHEEAIASFERIARWHILCLRELQEETGTNTDMHIDAAELGRCFTSLRQHYNDRREELGIEMPFSNEPEFRAYMLIYDLTNKSVSIPTAELPAVILDHPLVKLAWDIRRAAQRNFDSQKEGSKLNAELGANLITRFVKLLKQRKVPYLLGCLVEIRLREIRRSALRAMTRTYARMLKDPIRTNELGQVIERRMVLLSTLNKILGCEEQEQEESAWDDIDIESISDDNPNQEAINIAKKFGIDIYEDDSGPIGALINLATPFNDNRDAPYTRRWKSITEKRGNIPYADIVNGKAGIHIDGTAPSPQAPIPTSQKAISFTAPIATPSWPQIPPVKPTFSFGPQPTPSPQPTTSAFAPPSTTAPPNFSFTKPTTIQSPPSFAKAKSPPGAPVPSGSLLFAPDPKAKSPSPAKVQEQPQAAPVLPSVKQPAFTFEIPSTAQTPQSSKKKRVVEEDSQSATPAPAPLFTKPSFFASPSSTLGPSTTVAHKQPSPPKNLLPPTFSSPSSTTPSNDLSSSIIAPRQRKRNAMSLLSDHSTNGLSTSHRGNDLSASHRDRLQRQSLLPDVVDTLIGEIINSMITDYLSDDMEKLIKQRKAAIEYTNSKALRSRAIKNWSSGQYDLSLSEQIRRVSRAAILTEIKRRYLVRKTIIFWRKWAKLQRENREKEGRKREVMFKELKDMGLSRSIAIGGHQGEINSAMTSPISDIDMSLSLEGVRFDSLQIDIEINHAERTKDNFFAPSTFLNAIARHIAPLFSTYAQAHAHAQDQDEVMMPIWQTLISLVSEKDFGSADPDPEVQQWLINKFSSPHDYDNDNDEDEDGDEDGYMVDGISFESKVLGVDEKIPNWSCMGLIVLQIPIRTDDDRKQRENIADVQDRIGRLVKLIDYEGNRYQPSLLILTMEDESMDDIAQRLQIKDELEAFEYKALVSLSLSDDLDERFIKALEEVVPELPKKEGVVISIQDVLDMILPTWQRFLDIANLTILQNPNDVNIAKGTMETGIELLNKISKCIADPIEDVGREEGDTFKPIYLPKFTFGSSKKSLIGLAESIGKYMESSKTLSGIAGLDLLDGPIRQAAMNGNALPIIPILEILSNYITTKIQNRQISLTIFYPDSQLQGKRNFINSYIDDVKDVYEKYTRDKINSYSRLVPRSIITTTPDQRKKRSRPSIGSPEVGIGKTTDENLNSSSPIDIDIDVEKDKNKKKKGKKIMSKADKHAKLLKAMRDVEKTLMMSDMDIE